MSSTHTLIILVNSLTKTEKRYFHLYSNLQSGDKVYISLSVSYTHLRAHET